MSKSYNNHIPLFSEDDEVRSLVAKIVTDSKLPAEPKNPDEDNIFALHKLFSGDQLADIEKRYKEGGMSYKESKDILAANIINFITPLREKRKGISEAEALIVLKEGGGRAKARAELKMAEVRKAVGLSF
jgi:tryptophanyl-tRNA synthetase